MNYIQAKTIQGDIELFNLDHILSIKPRANGTTKILMGAGLYWEIRTDSIKYLDCINEVLAAVKGEYEA